MQSLLAASDVTIGEHELPGILSLPRGAPGIVIFAHGSGSSRLSPRNSYVAERLQSRRFATLAFDLLTEAESRNRANVFDVPLLAGRVVEAIEWIRTQSDLRGLRIGLFGASTGAAAALVAAATNPNAVVAIVSRGGRPDLAGGRLPLVEAPTLLIVGGEDTEVLTLNRWARSQMRCKVSLRIVPGATHLFEEPGALDAVIDEAVGWFDRYLPREA